MQQSVKCILVGLMMSVANVGYGQFNDTTNYFINISSIGIINKTNDRDSWLLNNNLRFALYKKKVSMNFSTAFIYGEQQDLLSNRDFTSSLDFNYYPRSERVYLWGLGSYEKNFSLRINNRVQAGLGIGYSLVNKKNAVINLSDGILYDRSDLLQGEGTTLDYETYRNSFRLKFRFLLVDKITIEGSDFLQHALSDRKDYIIRSHTNFSLKLMRWLSFTTGVTYNKMSITGRENLLINFGLTAEKYF